MSFARTFASLSVSLGLAACAAGEEPERLFMVTPGQDKSPATFQQDEAICQQHAVAHTGYGPLPRPAAPAGPAGGVANAPAATAFGSAAASPSPPHPEALGSPDELSYAQCMAARGDSVQIAPSVPNETGYFYSYPYPYVDPYPLVLLGGGFYGGWGAWNRHGWWHHHGWGYRGGPHGHGPGVYHGAATAGGHH